MADAVDQLGPAEQEITGIVLGVEGDLPATVLMLLTPEDAEKICVMLGLEPDSELAPSALGEIGNVVGTSYLNALAGMTGIEVEPTPPATVTDMLGAIVESVLAVRADVERPHAAAGLEPRSSRARTARSSSCSSPITVARRSCSTRIGVS